MPTYHSLCSECANLLDSPGGPLLEADAMDLIIQRISLMFTFSLPPDTRREPRMSAQAFSG